MNESEALLVVERGPVPSLRYALQQEQMTIGRSAGNELVLADPEVSRRHVRVLRRADGYAVEDIGSTNGTFVNGQRISHLTLLQDGDTIDLGDTVRFNSALLGINNYFGVSYLEHKLTRKLGYTLTTIVLEPLPDIPSYWAFGSAEFGSPTMFAP